MWFLGGRLAERRLDVLGPDKGQASIEGRGLCYLLGSLRPGSSLMDIYQMAGISAYLEAYRSMHTKQKQIHVRFAHVYQSYLTCGTRITNAEFRTIMQH